MENKSEQFNSMANNTVHNIESLDKIETNAFKKQYQKRLAAMPLVRFKKFIKSQPESDRLYLKRLRRGYKVNNNVIRCRQNRKDIMLCEEEIQQLFSEKQKLELEIQTYKVYLEIN